jgi:Flp pilus assembly protein TadD
LRGINRSKIEAREENMKTQTTLTLSVLLSALFFAAPVTNAKKRGGGDADAHRMKGIELAGAKQFDQALAEFNKAVEIAPDDPRCYHDRGTAYRAAARAAELAGDQAGASAKYTSAVTDFSKEIELAPKNAGGYVERSQTEDLLRQYDAALADANKAIELKGDEAL